MEEKFNIIVPYNNEIMVANRKKNKKTMSIILFIIAPIFLLLSILSGTVNNPSTMAVVIFAIFAAFSLGFGIYDLCTTKPKAKDDKINIEYHFCEDILQIKRNSNKENGKVKTLESCAYRVVSNKQHIKQITETEKFFEIKIYTGTVNMVAQYNKHILPKSCFSSEEELNNFKAFLQERVEKYNIN